MHAHRRLRGFPSLVAVLTLFALHTHTAAHAQTAAHKDSARTRFTVLAGYGAAIARSTSNYKAFYSGRGYYVDTYSSIWDGTDSDSPRGGSGLLLAAEYAFWTEAAIGIAYTTHGRVLGGPARVTAWIWTPPPHTIEESQRSDGVYLYGAWYPMPVKTSGSKASLRLAAGAGMSAVDISFEGVNGSYHPVAVAVSGASQTWSRFSLLGLAAVEWPVGASMGMGLSVEYRYMADLEVQAVTFSVPEEYPKTGRVEVVQPAHIVNPSCFKIGVFVSTRW
jgi:hypothetical protein